MKRGWILVGIVALVVFFAVSFRHHDGERPEGLPAFRFDEASATSTESSIDTAHFIDRARFDASLHLLSTDCKYKHVVGGVVNHHVLASDLLANVIGNLVACLPKNASLIIISPDHFLKSVTPVALGESAYTFDGQRLEIDQKALQTLAKLPFARIQPALFKNEHGIGALVPFILQVRPDLKLVPVAVRRSISDADLALFVQALAEQRTQGIFLLVSSDMSHYLAETQALYDDRQTLDAFSKNNLGFFETANDDFTDNGRSLAAVIRALGNPEWHLLDHSISSRYESSPLYTTSYITGVWSLRK